MPFPVSVGLVPTAPSSGITASKKGMARSAILGGWDREFAACGERKTSSGKKRQPPGVCLQASIWKEQVCLYNSRPPDLLRGLKFQRQGHVSPLPFEILAKTFLADRGSAHEEASSGSVLDITGCLPGLSSSRGLSLLVGPMSPLGEGGALFPPHCQRVEVEQTRSLRGKKKKDKLDGFLSSCYAAPLQDPLEQNRCPVAPRSGMQVHTPGVIPSKPIEASTAVIHVPIFCPKSTNTALDKLISPLPANVCNIPTDADDDWIIAVNTAPTNIPITGFAKCVIRFMNVCDSRSGCIEVLIISIPKNNIPRPAIICPK